MKKLIVISFFLVLIASLNIERHQAISKDIPTGYTCKCTSCGAIYYGPTMTLSCPLDGASCMCTKNPPIRL